jgi:hypothetical protein
LQGGPRHALGLVDLHKHREPIEIEFGHFLTPIVVGIKHLEIPNIAKRYTQY